MPTRVLQPHAIIDVRFRTTAEGGRKGPIRGDLYKEYRCPFSVDGQYFDCLVLTEKQIALGEWYTLPVIFLFPELVMPMLTVGKSFKLWEGKDVADGTVKELLPGLSGAGQ